MSSTWSDLPVTFSNVTSCVLKESGFSQPTPVQSACIPLFVGNKDVAVEAVTGSGKTLAFLIPIIEKIQTLHKEQSGLHKYKVYSIIISPTRELATQIYNVLQTFLDHLEGITSSLFIGGESIEENVKSFSEKGGHIVIATPGRLESLLEKPIMGCKLYAMVKYTEVLVLDEADRLLEMGFSASINTILGYLSKQRRTGLFSATQTDEVEQLIRAGLRNPVRIKVKEKFITKNSNIEQRTPSTLQNQYMIVDADEKFNHLIDFLQKNRDMKVMVFFSTCAGVEYFSQVMKLLLKFSEVICIHGKMKKKRNQIFAKFRAMTAGVLVCTDVMARGVDIPDVSWVIQYDPPSSAKAFVHRCGRTARIGNTGHALIFLLPIEDSYVTFLGINQKAPMNQMEKPESVQNCLLKVQKLAKKDRAIMEKGSRAYVSFVQSYAKHECSMIFRIKDLDFGKLATGFGLLRVPKMPELKGKEVKNFQTVEMDFASIPYKDKTREKQRQESLKNEENKKQKRVRPPRSVPWSNIKDKKDKKKKRKELRQVNKKRKLEASQEDIDDIDSDVRLLKKLKKGKMSQKDFDKEFADVEDDK